MWTEYRGSRIEGTESRVGKCLAEALHKHRLLLIKGPTTAFFHHGPPTHTMRKVEGSAEKLAMLSLVTGHVLQRQGRGICFLLFILPSSPLPTYPKFSHASERRLGDCSPLSLCVHVPINVASKAHDSAQEIAYMVRQTCFGLNLGHS